MKLSGIAVSVVLVIVAALGGFLAARYVPANTSSNLAKDQPPIVRPASKVYTPGTTQLIESSVLFKDLTADIQGKIIQSTPKSLTIQTGDNKSSTYPIDPHFSVYTYLPGLNQPKVSSSTADINPEQTASILLNFKDNQFQVVSVTYLNQTPASPVASSSAKPTPKPTL